MDVETLTRIAEFFAWLNLLHARLQLYRRSFVQIPEKREEYKIFVGGLQAERKREIDISAPPYSKFVSLLSSKYILHDWKFSCTQRGMVI